MFEIDQRRQEFFNILWVYPADLSETLDSATWLETTKEMRSLGWNLTLVSAGDVSKHCIQGVEVCCIPRPDIYILGQVVFHLRFLIILFSEWTTTQLVLFHQVSAPWILPLRFLRDPFGRKYPLFVMDTRTVPMTTATPKDKVRSGFYNFMNKMANRWADSQTAITARMAESVGIPSNQFWGTWPSGVNLDQFIPAQRSRRWPLTGEPIRLIYIGALARERNILSLCRAVEQANGDQMSFILSIFGRGPEQSSLENFALTSEGRIRIYPPVPHDQVPTILADSHIGVLPFPDEERFRVSSPVKLFEYMAAGIPILVTRIVCHADVVRNGEYAFWANDGSSESLLATLHLIWQSCHSLQQMGNRAAEAAQEWTWHETAKKLSCALINGMDTR